jgi:hypothetical protein
MHSLKGQSSALKREDRDLQPENHSRNSRELSHTSACGPTLLSGTVFWEVPMPGPVVCSMCDKTEEYCTCEKYCTICKGQYKVRLCADGLYYCPDCREACDVALANNRGH